METAAGIAAAPTPFLKVLARQLRAHDSNGAWERKTDAEILRPFVLDRAQRRALPVSGDPDPDVLWRVELLYEAVGLAIEARTGVACTPIMKMHHEGFGRMALVGGRLVVVNAFLRDVHRFGYDSLEALSEAGEALVSAGVEMIEAFPGAARWGA
jgi:probable nitrogen fixation protein